jgi:hypothetical protein
MLTPIGRLLPLMLGIIPPIDIPMLLARTLMTIPTVSIALRLLPLTVLVIPPVSITIRRLPLMALAIPTIGLATVLLPLMRLPIPAVSMALRLMPLTVLAMPTIGLATRLLPMVRRLPIPVVSLDTMLLRGASSTIRLRGKRTIRPGLGAQRAQSHKQAQHGNNAPPSLWSHLIILLKLILHSGFVSILKAARAKPLMIFQQFLKIPV